MRKCPKCGYTNYDDASQCQRCKFSLDGRINKPKINKKKVIFVSVIFIGLISVLYLGYRFGNKMSNKDADIFIPSLKSDTDYTYKFDEYTFSLPGYWPNVTGYSISNNQISWYQKYQNKTTSSLVFSIVKVGINEKVYYEKYIELKKASPYRYIAYYNTKSASDENKLKAEFKTLLSDVKTKLKKTFKLVNENTDESEEEDETTSEYIIPDSATKKLAEEDIKNLTKEQLYYARNEIYARHGYVFKSEKLNAYFKTKSWYKGTTKAEDFDESVLSETEIYNIKYLKSKGQ